MKELNVALAVVGGLILVVGLLSRPVDRAWFSPPMLAFLLGVAIGPQGTGLLNPIEWGDSRKMLEETARLTIGISLMGIALRLPPKYPLGALAVGAAASGNCHAGDVLDQWLADPLGTGSAAINGIAGRRHRLPDSTGTWSRATASLLYPSND